MNSDVEMASDEILKRLQDPIGVINDSDIEALQGDLNVSLPADYARFLVEHNGACFMHPVKFLVQKPRGFVSGGQVQQFFGVALQPIDESADIRENARVFSGRIPATFLPIVACQGDVLCIGTSRPDWGSVVLWDHIDEGEPDNIHVVADTFTEFFSGLRIVPEELTETRTPFAVVESGDERAVEKWLNANPDIEVRNEHAHSLLCCAARCRWPRIVRLLLARSASVDATDNRGWTPLFYAATHSSLECVALLLDAGADIHHRDKDGMTAAARARDTWAYRAAHELEARGAGALPEN
jgi:hypothetical protein